MFWRAGACCVLMFVASCAHQGPPPQTVSAPPLVSTAPSSAAPPQAEVGGPTAVLPIQRGPRTQVFKGTGDFTSPETGQEASVPTAGEGTTLNFENADIHDVAKAVLGDLLKLNYQIAGNVQGTVTIHTSEPLKPDAILPAFEQALNLSGLVIVKSGGILKIVTEDDAKKLYDVTPILKAGTRNQVGYGVEVVPLKYINAAQIQQLLAPLVPNPDMMQADLTRNLVFVRGTPTERQTILDNISLFDVDWLKGMSFALYTPQYADDQELGRELQGVIGGLSGPMQGIVRFVPIDRLNALLLISSQANYIDELLKWCSRLDVPGQGSDRRIIVYHVQNGRADDLASVLSKALSLPGASSQSNQPVTLGTTPATGVNAPLGANSMGPASDENAPPPTLRASPVDMAGSGTGMRELGEVSITPDDIDNSLIILATPKAYQTILDALHELDRQPLQVLLEAAIAEVTLTDKLRYGVQYSAQPDSHNNVVLSNGTTSAIASLFPGLSYTFNNGQSIQLILDALSHVTKVQVLSSPQVLVLNNQTATLQVGNQVPIVTQQAVSTLTSEASIINSIQYQNTGVILKVRPSVNASGLVMMDISQQVSDVTTTTSSSIDSPTIEQRQIDSTIAVADNETVAIGGLITTNKTKDHQGVPVLDQIPGLGALFRTTTNENDRTELIVLITPHVVNSTEKAREVSNELRVKLPEVERMLQEK